MPAGRIVAIDGPSASGKTELVRRLARTLGWVALPEAYRVGPTISLRFRTSAELVRLERRLIRREATRWHRAFRLAASGRDVLLDTSPWGPWTYTAGLVRLGWVPPGALDRVRALYAREEKSGRIGRPGLTLYLDVPAAERAARAHCDARGHPPRLYARHSAVAPAERELLRGPWGRRRRIQIVRVVPPCSAEALARRLAPRAAMAPRASLPRRPRAERASGRPRRPPDVGEQT